MSVVLKAARYAGLAQLLLSTLAAQPVTAAETGDRLRVPGGSETLARYLGDIDPDPERFVESLNRYLLAEIPTSDDWTRAPRRVLLVNYLDDLADLEGRFGRRIVVAAQPEESRERFQDLSRAMGFDLQRDESKSRFALVPREGDLAGRRRRLAQALRWDLLGAARSLGRSSQAFEIPESLVASPISFTDWNVWTDSTRQPVTTSTAIGALARDQRLSLLIEGRRHLTRETRTAFDRAALFPALYRSAPTAFFRYAEGFEVRGGQLVTPGGTAALEQWRGLVEDEEPFSLATFVPKLLTRRGGRVAFFWHALFELPAPVQRAQLDPLQIAETLEALGDAGSEGFLGPYGGDDAWSARLRSEAAGVVVGPEVGEIGDWWSGIRSSSLRVRAEGGAELLELVALRRRLPAEVIARHREAWREMHREDRRARLEHTNPRRVVRHGEPYEPGDPRFVVEQLGWLENLLDVVAITQPPPVEGDPGRGHFERALLLSLAPVTDPQRFALDGVGFVGQRGLDARNAMAASLVEQGVAGIDELIASARALRARFKRSPERNVARADNEVLTRLAEELRVALIASAYLPALSRADGPVFSGRSLVREHWLQGPLRDVPAGLADYLDLGGENADASAFQDASRIRRAFAEGLLGDWDSLTPEVSRRVADLIARGEGVLAESGEASQALQRSVVPGARLERRGEANAAKGANGADPSISWSERLAIGLAASEPLALGDPLHAAGVAMPHVLSRMPRGRAWVGRWPSYENLAHDRWIAPLEERGVVDLKLAVVRFLGRRGLAGNLGPDLMGAVIADLRTVRSEGPRDWESWVRFSSRLDDVYFEAALRRLLEQGLYQLE